eukprot:m.375119 g.375119  ORF g.375119 m.375119 type:complete len:85 (+) comp20914_c0_seq2:977-1231(+)
MMARILAEEELLGTLAIGPGTCVELMYALSSSSIGKAARIAAADDARSISDTAARELGMRYQCNETMDLAYTPAVSSFCMLPVQ